MINPALRHIGFVSTGPGHTRFFGELLGQKLLPGDILLLDGPFGAGKTTLVQGLALGAGAVDRVTSPSFTLINEYSGRLRIYHVDLFRLKSLDLELEQALEDSAGGDGVTVVEWPQLLPDDLKAGALRLDLQILGESARGLVVHSEETRWAPAELGAIIERSFLLGRPGEGEA